MSSAVMALREWRSGIASCPAPTRPPIAIVAMSNRFWMEWAIYAAHRIYAQGYRPVVVYAQWEVEKAYRWDRQTGGVDADFWSDARACRYLSFVDLDEPQDTTAAAPYDDLAARSANVVVAYALGIEEGEGDAVGDQYWQALARATTVLRDMGPRVETALSRCQPLRVICPSGLLVWSSTVMEACRRLSLPAVFVETFTKRPGHMVWNVNRPAVDVDIEGWLQVVGEWDAAKERDVAAFAAFQERRVVEREEWLDNSRVFQRRSHSEQLPDAIEAFLAHHPRPILAGPNIVADSATLGRATIFRSQQEWIRELIAFFRRRPDLGLIIRAHPAEFTDQPRCRIGDMARELAASAPNILVIDGRESVSTYALVDRCVLGLMWVSNVGVDMVIRRRPVLLAAAARYATLGICHTASSGDAYFDTLGRLAEHPPVVDAETVRRAKLFQWIVFKRMSLEATARSFQSRDYCLASGWMHPDQEIFYQVLTGDRSDKGLPLPEAHRLVG